MVQTSFFPFQLLLTYSLHILTVLGRRKSAIFQLVCYNSLPGSPVSLIRTVQSFIATVAVTSLITTILDHYNYLLIRRVKTKNSIAEAIQTLIIHPKNAFIHCRSHPCRGGLGHLCQCLYSSRRANLGSPTYTRHFRCKSHSQTPGITNTCTDQFLSSLSLKARPPW